MAENPYLTQRSIGLMENELRAMQRQKRPPESCRAQAAKIRRAKDWDEGYAACAAERDEKYAALINWTQATFRRHPDMCGICRRGFDEALAELEADRG